MRIKIFDEEIRRLFFDSVKAKYNKSWKKIRIDLFLTRACLDRYKSGESLIPEKLFFKLLKVLDNNEKEKIIEKTQKFDNNWGQVKGGKIAYELNYEKFKEGRMNASKIKRKKFFLFEHIQLSNKICELIGAFIGDGFFNCYNNKLYQVEFSGDSRLDLDYYSNIIIPIIKNLFPNINPHIYKVKYKNAIRIVFYSKELFCYLRDVFGFVPGKKTYTISIPPKILSSKQLLFPTIRGIFDTDGGIFLDKRDIYKKSYPRIVFQTASNKLYEQLLVHLSKEFKIYSRQDKKRNIGVIEIYGTNQLNKWMNLIGFSNSRHLNKIASVA